MTSPSRPRLHSVEIEPVEAVEAAAASGGDLAGRHARRLLRDLDMPPSEVGTSDGEPAVAWAGSGAMALTGEPGGPPALAPGGLTASMTGAALALAALTRDAAGSASGTGLAASLPDAREAPALLGERAALFGWTRAGRVSPGGSCRLLRAQGGWLALNLARADDLDLLPAWLEDASLAQAAASVPRLPPWSRLERLVRRRDAGALVERGRLLGLPIAAAAQPPSVGPPWRRVVSSGARRRAPSERRPRVIDLSALWAGPLCADLLRRAGALVVKVECHRRPDGARRGEPRFYDLLNAGKRSVALDFHARSDLHRLERLLQGADIVVESARPRALAQLGIRAERLVAECPGLTWVSITGHGRSPPEADWVAFGDDAAVAAGLATAVGTAAAPLFCGDAIADPLAGIHAAVAALCAHRAGGGQLIDVNLREVAACAAALDSRVPRDTARVVARDGAPGAEAWELIVAGERHSVASPRARAPVGRARPLGADSEAVLRELEADC